MVLEGCSYSTARRHLRVLCDVHSSDVLQATQLATYWGTSLDDLSAALSLIKRKISLV
jgi:hypothetical protein